MDQCEFGKTADGLHDKVMELLDKLPRGRLLDAPAGTGELSYLLQKQGFDVVAGDIDESVVKARNVQIKKLDLNGLFPFEDSAFDYCINVEGLEHLENPFHTLREFSRVLKPGGVLIMTTPNVLNVFSRLRYVLIGFHANFGDYYMDERNFYTLHINPVGFPEIAFAVKRCGLAIEKITTNRNAFHQRGWLGQLGLRGLQMLIRAATLRKVRPGPIRDGLLSPAILQGEILIIKCVKPDTLK